MSMAAKYRITLATIDPDDPEQHHLQVAVVDGFQSDYERLRQFLHGMPLSKVNGTPSRLRWHVSAERRSLQWEPVVEEGAVT